MSSHRPVDRPPLKLRPKRRVLFPDMIDLRLPRRRPKSELPARRIEPARLPVVAPPSARPAPPLPPPAPFEPPVNRDVAVLDESTVAAAPRRAPVAAPVAPASNERTPMYWRLLRLRYVRPNGWLRALFVEGSVGLAVVLVLAEKASIWTILALPVVVAVLVKANDLVAGALSRSS
jgi:hypothetical protein